MTRPSINQQIHLVSRPLGEPSADNFRLVPAAVPALTEGQILVRHHWLSLDPYMRGRMDDGASYADPQPLNQVMIGSTVGEVVESRNAQIQPGQCFVSMGGWQQYQVVDAHLPDVLLQPVDAALVPLSAYLGAAGMPAVTAWFGLTRIMAPKAGETVVVSSASGAVGSAVGQLAQARGARAVGLAGGPDKCRYVVDELGFDACIDYKRHPDVAALSAALREACPRGIDAHFENVGGLVLDAALQNANPFSRIALCGMIAGYDGQPTPMAEPQRLLVNRIRLEGFIISDHMDVWPEALGELIPLVASGLLKYRETVAQGIAAAPEAFLGLLKGRSLGKQLVRLV